MDTIKVAWMSLRLRPKSFPWVFREVRCTWAREGGLLSHPMLRIKSLLIFQEAHSPILPFAHLFCFSILPPPPLFPLFLFSLYHEWISSLETKEKNRSNEFPFSLLRLPRKIFTTVSFSSVILQRENSIEPRLVPLRFPVWFNRSVDTRLMISGSPSCLRRNFVNRRSHPASQGTRIFMYWVS